MFQDAFLPPHASPVDAVRLHYRPLRYLAARYGSRWNAGLGFGPAGFVRLEQAPAPELPGLDWVRVRPNLSGVCGSDLAAVTAHDSFLLEPFTSFPFTLGHENVGTVTEAGTAVEDVAVGDRVVVNPILACRQRGIEPRCAACARGEDGLCRNFTHDGLGPGFSTGYCGRVGGGWSGGFVAHRSQLHPVPDLTDEQGVLVDAFASALRPVLLHPPAQGERVLVIGAGTIGLLTIRALRATGWSGPIAVAARHPFQQERADAAGADPVLRSREEVRGWAAGNGARRYRPSLAPEFVEGGPAIVYDTVGTASSLQDALSLAREDGRIVLVGAAARVTLDLTRVWFRQVALAGVIAYGEVPWKGDRRDVYAATLELVRAGALDGLELVTHVFDIRDYRAALRTALSKSDSRAIKVALRPGS